MSTPVLTWFGNPDDPADRVPFRVEPVREGAYPDWEADELVTVHHITGSNHNDLFVDGFGPETLTLVLRFDCRADYRAFHARRHTTGTLQLLAGYTSIPGEEVTEHGRVCERYHEVFLRAPSRVAFRVGGIVECQAAFVLAEVPA